MGNALERSLLLLNKRLCLVRGTFLWEHCRRVGNLAAGIAEALGLARQQVMEWHLAGRYHDLGKIHSDIGEILLKPGPLTAEERRVMDGHPERGYEIVVTVPGVSEEYPGLPAAARFHHERWDGKGYPQGLMAAGIPLIARAVGIADAFEAMTAARSYRVPLSVSEALSELGRHAGTQFDPELVRVAVDRWREVTPCVVGATR